MPKKPANSRSPTDPLVPRQPPARRYSAHLAAALAICYQRGYDFTEHFPPPHDLHEIADIVQFFVEPMLRRDYRRHVADAMHWIAVTRLCNFGLTERLITDHQMAEGVWDDELGTPVDLGTGFSRRANRYARDELRRLGLIRFERRPNGLVASLVINGVLRAAADAVVGEMSARHGKKGLKARMERLRVVGTATAGPIGTPTADLIGTATADKDTSVGDQ